MLGAVVDIALWLFIRRRRKQPFPDIEHRPPSSAEESRARAVERRYAHWAEEHRFLLDPEMRGYRGRLTGREVLIRPGLDGSAPISAEAEIAIAHDETATFLVTSKQRADRRGGTSDIGEALVALFEEPGLVALRAVAVVPNLVRLRFAPLTEAETVQAAIDRAVANVEERLRARLGGVPYR